jgi:glycosyltransferase involved in cell wall biosynthesis
VIRLCIITTIPSTIRAFIGEQLRYLQQSSFDITIITAPDEAFAKSLPEEVKYEPVLMTRVVRPLQDIKAFFKILHILKQDKFDIVQYATPKAALLGSLASCFAKVPVRLYLMWGLYYVTQTGFKKFLFKTIEKIICSCSTAIAPDSKGNVKLAIGEGLCKADKIAVVGHGSANGVDTERFNPARFTETRDSIRSELNIPKDSVLFGSMAPLVGDKGINELVSAFDELAKRRPNIFLLIIGGEREKDFVRPATITTIKEHPRIRNIPRTTEPEKYLAAMDIFVLPTYREGFGVVNIEASAMGLPVISTDVPGPQESIVNGETGILVPAKEVNPLVQAMTALLDRPSYAKKLGEAGRKRVQDFYEQKKLWQSILEHKKSLLEKAQCSK